MECLADPPPSGMSSSTTAPRKNHDQLDSTFSFAASMGDILDSINLVCGPDSHSSSLPNSNNTASKNRAMPGLVDDDLDYKVHYEKYHRRRDPYGSSYTKRCFLDPRRLFSKRRLLKQQQKLQQQYVHDQEETKFDGDTNVHTIRMHRIPTAYMPTTATRR